MAEIGFVKPAYSNEAWLLKFPIIPIPQAASKKERLTSSIFHLVIGKFIFITPRVRYSLYYEK